MKTFEELGVSPEIRRAIEEMGYAYPMPVQEEAIPYLLGENNDIVALAQTGTGKTAAFGLPLIQKIVIEDLVPQSLILCPTRELCLQIAGDLNDYSKYVEGLKVLPVYGGSSIESQIRALKRGVHIIVATPGRLLDLMERKTVSLATVKNVVMDEADEMLDMGFSDSINAILADVPQERNTLMFSATMSPEISKIAKNYLRDPKEVTIGRKNESTANVRHVVYMVHAKDKYETLKRIVDYYPRIYAIIFCRTRKETQEIAEKLMQEGYNADTLHGDLSQAQRDVVMQRFRLRNIQLLVATDVAARGLDVDDLTHVINYGLPDDVESYTHRSGRTGRAGKTGTSIAIINLREKSKVKQIEKIIGKQFEAGEIPTARQICEKQLIKVIDELEKVQVNEEEINEFMPEIYRKLDWLGKEDIIKRMVSHEFNRFYEYYRNKPEIETATDEKGGRRDRGESGKGSRQAEPGYSRLFINLGKIDGLTVGRLMEIINKNIPERINVGRIDLMKRFSFFEVEERDAETVVNSLDGKNWKGYRLGVEIAGGEPSASSGAPKKPSRRRGGSDEGGRRGGDSRDSRDFRDFRGGDSRDYRDSRGGGSRRGDSRRGDSGRPSKRFENADYEPRTSRSRKDDWKQFFQNDGWSGDPVESKRRKSKGRK